MSPPELSELRALLESGNASDRAYVDAMLRMRWARGERNKLAALLDELRAVSLRAHRELRELRGPALRRGFGAVDEAERDHLVEEVLGIAYPPLDEPALGPELTPYAPSGYDEILHAFDVSGLGPSHRFLDLGSGTGKAVMLAEMLTGATSEGVECNAALCELATESSRALGLSARTHQGDARDADLGDPDVVFMYLPFTGSVMASVMTRLLALHRSRRRYLCTGAVDARRYPELIEVGPSRSWLHVYAWP